VTSVRLVEPPPVEKKIERPPERASAISDRNHSTQRERIPKQLPGSRSLLGRVEPPLRIAALSPPTAPEDLVKSGSEKRKKHREKPDAEERAPKKDLQKNKAVERKKNIRNLHVDLSPTPREVAQGLSRPGGSKEFFSEGDPDEVVVDINTREDKFFSYLLHLKQKIQGVWIYPAAAARAGVGGSLTVEFAVGNDGRLLYANLLDSSGHNLLDQSALRAIQTAAPYYPFPARMKAKRLRIRANFIYVTGNYFRGIM
jgi:protein TonB